MDIVYNHSSPDAVLKREHPEWYWKSPDGKPAPRIADWSDVAGLTLDGRPLMGVPAQVSGNSLLLGSEPLVVAITKAKD